MSPRVSCALLIPTHRSMRPQPAEEPSTSSYLKPFEYFSRQVPAEVGRSKFFCINRAGTISYAISFHLRSIFNVDTQIMNTHKEIAAVCKMDMISGRSTVFQFEERLTVTDIRTAVDCYLLHDNMLVLVCHNRQTSEISQLVIYLCRILQRAMISYVKKKTFTDISYEALLGLGLLECGRVAVVGSRGAYDGEREFVAHLIAADPVREKDFPDVNLTSRIEAFCEFLKNSRPDCWIFQNGIFFDTDGIYFLIKKTVHSHLVSDLIGKLLYKSSGGGFECELVNLPQGMLFDGALSTRHLVYAIHHGKNLWMVLEPPNYGEMVHWNWRLYYWWLPNLLWLMILGLRFSLWLRHLDNGWSLGKYVRLLQWTFGPTLTPSLEADPVFLLYHLDLQKAVLRRAEASPQMVATGVLNYFDVAADVDSDGGLTLAELPANGETWMKLSHYASPRRASSLARLAGYSVYRHFPSFERSFLVRRMLGQTEHFG